VPTVSNAVSAIVEIILLDTKPAIRRRVSVPYSLLLSRFHLVLQITMGWPEHYAHFFLADDLIVGNPREIDHWNLEDESRLTLGELLPWIGAEAAYIHVIDQEWRHQLRLIDLEAGTGAPTVLSGKGVWPPEKTEPISRIRREKSSQATSLRGKKTGVPKRKKIPERTDTVDVGMINQELTRLTNRWKKKRRASRVNTSRELLPVDSAAIRDGYLRGLREIRQRVRGIEDELARHEAEDLPEFRRYVSAAFAARFTLLRELHQEVDWLSARLTLVQKLMQYGVRPVGRAYLRALRIEAGEEPYPDFRPAPEPEAELEELLQAELTEDAVRDFISSTSDEFLNAEEKESLAQDLLGAKTGAFERAKTECKNLYRKIVQLLHPDRAGEMTKETKELWLRAQAAYADADLLSLRSILDRCHTGKENQYLSCSEVIEATAEAAIQLQAMELLRERVAKEPSWHFCRLTEKKRKSRVRHVADELDSEKADLQSQLDELRRECAHLDQQAKRWATKQAAAGYQPDLFE
jgi:hypothetical protein